jgi:DNA-binding IclR family transcriptional regulator
MRPESSEFRLSEIDFRIVEMVLASPAMPLVQSVARSLEILEALAGPDELGLVEIAGRTGLQPSTTHRLLATLLARGFVARNGASGRYALGHKIAELAGDRSERLRTLARPHLAIVQRETGETANLSILAPPNAVYIDQVDGSRAVRMLARIGAAVPAHASAAGKAMLAHAPAESLAALPLTALTAKTITTLAGLERELEAVRTRGYALDDEEHEPGLGCVAAPILDHRECAVAALSISAPIQRIRASFGPLLAAQAAEISHALGSP